MTDASEWSYVSARSPAIEREMRRHNLCASREDICKAIEAVALLYGYSGDRLRIDAMTDQVTSHTKGSDGRWRMFINVMA